MYPFLLCMVFHLTMSSNLVDMNDTMYYKANMDFPGYEQPKIDTKIQEKLVVTCQIIKKLDKNISQIMTNGTKGDGDQLLNKLKAYNEEIQQLLISAKKHKLPTLCAAEDILKKGGPKFMDIEVDKQTLKQHLNWSDSEYQKFVDLQKVTFKTWSILFGINNNFP